MSKTPPNPETKKAKKPLNRDAQTELSNDLSQALNQDQSQALNQDQNLALSKGLSQILSPDVNPEANPTDPSIVVDTVIIGAGISGIAAAVKLKQAAYDDYLILEKADRVGGTWRDNTYPGCGCDVPSALYSFSFAPSSEWSHVFAKQPEILSYLQQVSEQFDIQKRLNLIMSCSVRYGMSKNAYGCLKHSKGLIVLGL